MGFVAPLIAGLDMAAGAGTVAGGLSTIGTFGSLVGSIFGAVGKSQEGKAAEASAKYNAQVAANNATLAEQSARLAGAAGNAQTEQAQLKTRAQVGGIIATQGASGVDVSSGSALDVRSSAKQLGQLNALTVRSNAAKSAYGYQTEAANYKGQEGLYDYQASTIPTATNIGIAGTVLGGASDAASKYADFQLQSNSLNGS